MDFVQDRITTIHHLSDQRPASRQSSFAAIVPMLGRELEGGGAREVLQAIDAVDPELIVVPVRADEAMIRSSTWLVEEIEAPVEVLWCNAPGLDSHLKRLGLPGPGKGRDVWLATGIAATEAEVLGYIDADIEGFTPTQVERLISPIDASIAFSKGYYARVEDGRLYGRLFRLLIQPLIAALQERNDHALLAYLDSFRYALSGEFAVRADVVTGWSFPADMGLEIGLLGEGFRDLGFDGSAQVDLGFYRHDHRPVRGPNGLEGMAPEVIGALADVIERHTDNAWSDEIEATYLECANRLIEQYERDATGNGLDYDRSGERAQVERYRKAIREPSRPEWLPPWSQVSLAPQEVRERSVAALSGVISSRE